MAAMVDKESEDKMAKLSEEFKKELTGKQRPDGNSNYG